ncbi:MAG TPA: hypothetical protein VF665_18000 [Longimicrobium sp.]|jgi:hypothetical protein|uniref:plasmid mobilization protein n=1 Tax=Longimicrobium sp. TaxID=2029185 RepID=UPI002EDA6F27
MRAKRTIRRPTRWTQDEWRRVEDAARARRVPPARFIREAVLGAVAGGGPLAAPRRRRVRDELVHQLGRVLNNLRQLERLAVEDGNDIVEHVTAATAQETEAAIRRAPTRAGDAGPLVVQLIDIGRALNEVAHRANTDEALPPDEEVTQAVTAVFAFVSRALA